MKKFISILLSAALLSGFFGCTTSGDDSKDTLSGDTAALLNSILEKAADTLAEDERLPASMTVAVTEDDAQGNLGLSPEDFNMYVESASVSTAMIGSFAHKVALAKAKDSDSANEVKKLIKNGFDHTQWICVFPEKCMVADSGTYIILIASRGKSVDAIYAAFETEAQGNIGTAETFYEKPGE